MRRSRQTKIVATIGPKSGTEDVMAALFEAGADVFRFNFSHGTQEEHAERLRAVRSIEKNLGRPIAVFADLQGPKLRVGEFSEGSVTLETGAEFRLDLSEEPGNRQRAPLLHPEILAVLRPGSTLLLDDGKLQLEVVSCTDEHADTRVVTGGPLSNHKGVNLPNVVLNVSPITEKDRKDLEFAIGIGIGMIALSFVQRPSDIEEARRVVDGRAKLIAKLEKPSAVEDLDKIVELTDAVMVARGDLGVELPPERVPAIQKRVIRACRQAGKPVIVATQMLDSMIKSRTPTRAEASDVANAVYDGADAVMLSGETAVGDHPLRVVEVMDRIVRFTEQDPAYRDLLNASQVKAVATEPDTITQSASTACETLSAAAIVTFTTSGATAVRAARRRPSAPILALTPDPDVARMLTSVWGVHPILVPAIDSPMGMGAAAIRCATENGFAKQGDRLVVTAGLPLQTPGVTNILRLIQVE